MEKSQNKEIDRPDFRYSLVAPALREGKIKRFDQIFKVIPKTVVCHTLGIKTRAFDVGMANLGKWKFEYIFVMAKLFGMPEKKLLLLAFDHWKRSRIKRRPRKKRETQMGVA